MAAVVKAARALGWAVQHETDSRRSAAGWPDLTLCRPPRLMFWELKAQGRRATDAQWTWLGLLTNCPGVEAGIYWPDDWPEIEAELRREA